jgi:hypothetical protein
LCGSEIQNGRHQAIYFTIGLYGNFIENRSLWEFVLSCSSQKVLSQKDLKNMLVDNLLPELKLKQSNIPTMGDFNFDLQNKNFRFSEFMEHTFSSK